MIEVAGDGNTAKGLWFITGAETSPKDDDRLDPHWTWARYATDFIREDGKWKIVHFFKDPALYERARPLYKQFIPVLRQMFAAGWEPVTHAQAAPEGVRVASASAPTPAVPVDGSVQPMTTNSCRSRHLCLRQSRHRPDR